MEKTSRLFNLTCRPVKRLCGMAVAIPFLVFGGPLNGQTPAIDELPEDPAEFSLFGDVDSGDSNNATEDRRSTRRGRNISARENAEPEFILVGTSRIGDRYSAILKNRDGTEVVVTAQEGRNTRIEGYSSFSVVDVSAGRVSIQYPGSSACIDFQDRGVSCNSASNIASLELTMGDPIPRAVITSREEPEQEVDDGEVVVSDDDEEQPTNPFAALRARALEDGNVPVPTDRSTRAFTPRRIPPEDVPPGMRVVSTPFGDRLVRE